MRPDRLAVAALLAVPVAALAVVIGPPDLRAAAGLLSGTAASSAGELAFLALLCWLVVIAVVVALLAGMTRALGARRVSSQRLRAVIVLSAGLALLGVGAARHAGGYRVCCSSAATAQQVQNRVH